MTQRRSVLLTGYPTFLSRHVARALLAEGFTGDLFLLAPQKLAKAGQRFAQALPKKRGAAVHLLAGDVLDMHLGLPGAAFRELAGGLTEIFHLAEITHPSAAEAMLRKVNIDGTRNLLDVLRELPKVKKLLFASTAFVSGDRQGVIAEDEGDVGQRVLDPYAASKLEAERLLRRCPERVGVTRLRPSFIVGHSRTGETDRLEGPLYLGLRLGLSSVPVLPVSEGADQPLHVVPVDYVAAAIAQLSTAPEIAGRAFHLVDPNPLSVRRFYEALAGLTEKRVQTLPISREASEVVMRLPLVETLFRPQRRGWAQAGQMVFFTQEGTTALLAGRTTCPPLRQYLPKLLAGAKLLLDQRRDASAVDSLEDESAAY